jgi:GNAT superfamily N-acetyltransferase
VPASEPLVLNAEAELDERAFPLPLASRTSWAKYLGSRNHAFAIARTPDGQVAGLIGIEETPTRALPGHRVIRLHSVEDAYATDVGSALLDAVVDRARGSGRVLSVAVELECLGEGARGYLREALEARAFRQVRSERIPSRTLALELSPSEDAIQSSFSATTRTRLRRARKLGIDVRPLTSDALCDFMNAMLHQTFARTRGRIESTDWTAIMAMSNEVPRHSRLIGVFDGARSGPDALVAFAWGHNSGSRAVYHMGASIRSSGAKIPLLDLAMWDLIAWAKREGAHWFDFGGVSAAEGAGDDPLAGISEFKRRFCRNEIAFGEEWVFEPSPAKASIARSVVRSLGWVRRNRGK